MDVDGLSLVDPVQRPMFHSIGIFQSRLTTSIIGITESSVTVVGNRELKKMTQKFGNAHAVRFLQMNLKKIVL